MPALTTANLIAWLLQVAAIVLAGGVTLRAVRLQPPFARLACLRALLVVCLVLPFVEPVAVPPSAGPGTDLSIGVAGAELARPGATDVAGADLARRRDGSALRGGGASSAPTVGERVAAWASGVGPLLPFVVAGGILARLAWLLIGLAGLARLRRGTDATGDAIARAFDLVPVRADVRTSAIVRRPVTFGVLRPVVLLPTSFASLTEAEQTTVVCHELLHVRRRDWPQTVGEELVRAALWFHPAIWWLLAQIDLAREQRVDEQVVALTERRQPYLNALVTLALAPARPVLRPASLFLGRAHLLQRVALLSREVRMSRSRLVASLAVMTIVLAFGGRLAVQAFPLTPVSAHVASIAAPVASPGTAAAPTSEFAGPRLAAGSKHVAPHVDLAKEPEAGVRTGRAQAAPAPVRVGGPIRQPAKVKDVRPVMPEIARNARVQGAVILEIVIGTDGKVQDAKILRSIPLLDQAALDAVKQWEYVPTLLNGTPVPVIMTVTVSLLLEGDAENYGAASLSMRGVPPEEGSLRAVYPDAVVRGMPGVVMPTATRMKRPAYSPRPGEERVNGSVTCELLVGTTGRVEDVRIRRSDYRQLDQPAVDAAWDDEFTPATKDGSPVRAIVEVTFYVTSGRPGGVQGGVAGGVPGGVSGGVRGGVPGGVSGGVIGASGGVAADSGVPSFGPPRSEWPTDAAHVGGDIKMPIRIRDVRPVYPQEAQYARVQGVVIVEALIGTDGKVQAARILRSIPMLDQAAMDAVKQWEYTPTLVNGVAVPIAMTLTVNFTMQ